MGQLVSAKKVPGTSPVPAGIEAVFAPPPHTWLPQARSAASFTSPFSGADVEVPVPLAAMPWLCRTLAPSSSSRHLRAVGENANLYILQAESWSPFRVV